MTMKFKTNDGLCESSNANFVQLWNDITKQQQNEKISWIDTLRKQGVKASHPNDGWVDRNKNEITFAYPQFDDDVNVGDTIALGWPDKYKLVKVIEIVTRPSCWIGTKRCSYLFSDEKEE